MVGFGLIRCGCNVYGQRTFHLSILSGEGLSVSEDPEFPFPFDNKEGKVFGGSCGGWLCFHGYMGGILLWNLTSQEWKALPPPPGFTPRPDMFVASGMGYVAKLEDYKVIRHYVKVQETIDETGAKWFADADLHYEVWSFNKPSWRAIRGPHIDMVYGAGVYVNVTGRCYWPAYYIEDSIEHEKASYGEMNHVVSFDFATERFSHFPLPETRIKRGEDATFSLVACCGSLGALVHVEPNLCKSPKKDIELHVFSFNTKAWQLLHVVSQLADVARPILGLKDDRWLLLESKPRDDGRCQLKAYDLSAKTEEKLDIYDYPEHVKGFSYAESTGPPLPPVPPLHRASIAGGSSRQH